MDTNKKTGSYDFFKPVWAQAIRNNDTRMVKGLLDLGINPNMDVGSLRDKDDSGLFFSASDVGVGSPALSYAARFHNTEVCKLLIEHGADVNAGYMPPLHFAAINGDTEICKLLIERGADVNAKGRNVFVPLYLAVVNAHTEICKMLIEHGADVKVECYHDETKQTLLQIAHNTKLQPIIDLLQATSAKEHAGKFAKGTTTPEAIAAQKAESSERQL